MSSLDLGAARLPSCTNFTIIYAHFYVATLYNKLWDKFTVLNVINSDKNYGVIFECAQYMESVLSCASILGNFGLVLPVFK